MLHLKHFTDEREAEQGQYRKGKVVNNPLFIFARDDMTTTHSCFFLYRNFSFSVDSLSTGWKMFGKITSFHTLSHEPCQVRGMVRTELLSGFKAEKSYGAEDYFNYQVI